MRHRRTGASPGALPSVWPAALDAPSPCSVDALAQRRDVVQDVVAKGREPSLSACCFWNLSLAPEPPGVLEGIVGMLD